MSRTTKIPIPLWKLFAVGKTYKDENDENVWYSICLSFGDERVWIMATLDKYGDPILEFSQHNMKNPPMIKEK